MKTVPFTLDYINSVISNYPTPFHVYDESGIRNTCKGLYDAFKWSNGFRNYYAVKALPNPSILEIVKSEGMGADCSSLAELVLAERAGFSGEQIMFTSNDTSVKEFVKANSLGAIINLDDISHIEFFEKAVGKLPELICFRYNPGNDKVGNELIGPPAESKYGLTKEQMLEAYRICQTKGIKRFGVHIMPASNVLDNSYFVDTAKLIFDLSVQLKKDLNIEVEFINLGGGFGIAYKPDQQAVNLQKISSEIKNLYDQILKPRGLSPKLYFEHGRYITGPHGYLVSTVLHLKHTYRDYVGLDSSMADLMRPGMYGAYHHITILGKETEPENNIYDVTGSLCENNDKFAIQRALPKVEIGDIVVIHDTGAHGHSMGFNYNGKLRSAELLLNVDGKVKIVRRAETLEDHFATLNGL